MSSLLYLSDASFSNHSANGIHIARICEALSEKIDVFLLHRGRSKNDLKIFNHDSTVKRYGTSFFIFDDLRVIYILNLLELLFRKPKAKIYGRSYFGILIAFMLGKKIVLELHDMPKGYIQNKIFKLLISNKNCLKIVSITEALREDLCKLSKKNDISSKIVVFPDGADYFETTTTHLNSKLAYFGSFYKGKGYKKLAELAKTFPEFIIDCYGDSSVLSNDEISDKPENLFLKGLLPHKQSIKTMGEYAVLLLPLDEKVEGIGGGDIAKYTSPLKLFEYMASGRPIVASNRKVFKEVVNEDVVYFVDHEDIDAWARCIKKLIEDPSASKKRGELGKELIEKKYSWNVRARSILELYE